MRSSIYSFLHVFGRIRYKRLFQQPLPDDASGRHWRRVRLAFPHWSKFHPLITLARFHIFACRTPAQAVNHSAATASAGLDMSRSRSCCHRSTARSLHHWLTPPLVERSLHLRRREPVHQELLLQHVLLRLQRHALVNPSCGCHPADRWSRPLDAPALLRPRFHPPGPCSSVRSVLSDSRIKYTRPTAHAQ